MFHCLGTARASGMDLHFELRKQERHPRQNQGLSAGYVDDLVRDLSRQR